MERYTKEEQDQIFKDLDDIMKGRQPDLMLSDKAMTKQLDKTMTKQQLDEKQKKEKQMEMINLYLEMKTHTGVLKKGKLNSYFNDTCKIKIVDYGYEVYLRRRTIYKRRVGSDGYYDNWYLAYFYNTEDFNKLANRYKKEKEMFKQGVK